jgi:hypothetical protein
VLDREKLAKDVFSIVSKLFPDVTEQSDLAKRKWREISCDDSFVQRAQDAQSSFLIPRWDGNLSDTFLIPKIGKKYSVLAVDGSQIYPDRHVAGAGCFLINVGGVRLDYGETSSVEFFSEPHVLLPSDIMKDIGKNSPVLFSRDLVDLKREEYELAVSAERASREHVCLVDGTIVFWPLDGKPNDVKNFFLDRYISSLEKLYKNKTLVAGYISMPKSRELVALIKLGLCRFTVADCIRCHRQFTDFPCKKIDPAQGACVLDTNVARFFLKKHHRTTVFYSTSKIIEFYPEHLRPAFVYCDVGSEIVRIEIPTWVAQDRKSLDYICAVAIDQSEKGRGYPVCLAEAHEQAVVKGGDREFFYHLLCKVGLDHNKPIRMSQKAIKKRGIGV